MGLSEPFSMSRKTACGMRSVVLWIRAFLRSSQPGSDRQTSSIQVILRALKKFFFTKPTEFSIGYPTVLLIRMFCKRPHKHHKIEYSDNAIWFIMGVSNK